MNDKKRAATPETRKALYDNTGKTIEHFSPLLKKGVILTEIQLKRERDSNNLISNAFLNLNNYILYMNI